MSSGPVGKVKMVIIESFATIGRPTRYSHIQFLPKGTKRMTQLACCGKDMLESKGRQDRHVSYAPTQGGVGVSLSVPREVTPGNDLYHTHVVYYTSSWLRTILQPILPYR